MKLRFLFAAAVLASAAGCSSSPPHAFNYDPWINSTTTVLNRHFNNKLEACEEHGASRVIRTGYNEMTQMNERERWYAVATITPIDEEEASVDVDVFRSHDESDTGYGERSPSNPKWGVETHWQDEERKLLGEIHRELEVTRHYGK